MKVYILLLFCIKNLSENCLFTLQNLKPNFIWLGLVIGVLFVQEVLFWLFWIGWGDNQSHKK